MTDWLEGNRSNLAALLVVLVAVAGITLLQLPRRPALQVVAPSVPAAPPTIKVHVVGAVRSPGVYALESDARVEDALKVAGGPSESADVSSLNLATPLRDGQQVAIPQAGSLLPPSAAPLLSSSPSSPGSALLDLNSASLQELDVLPGIGPVTAQKILDYRQKNGRIASVQELRDAKLVNSSTYEKIKGLVEAR